MSINLYIWILLYNGFICKPMVSMFMGIKNSDNRLFTNFLYFREYLFTYIIVPPWVNNNQSILRFNNSRIIHKSLILFIWANHWSMHNINIIISFFKFKCSILSKSERCIIYIVITLFYFNRLFSYKCFHLS